MRTLEQILTDKGTCLEVYFVLASFSGGGGWGGGLWQILRLKKDFKVIRGSIGENIGLINQKAVFLQHLQRCEFGSVDSARVDLFYLVTCARFLMTVQ